MSTMAQSMPGGSSAGFGPQGFGPPSGQHFGQGPPGFGPPLPPPPPAAAGGPTQHYDYGHGMCMLAVLCRSLQWLFCLHFINPFTALTLWLGDRKAILPEKVLHRQSPNVLILETCGGHA